MANERAVLRSLLKYYLPLAARPGRTDVSLRVIEALLPKAIATLGHGFDSSFGAFVDQKREKLMRLYNADPERAPAFLFQPESLLVFMMLDADPTSVADAWPPAYAGQLAMDLATLWGVQAVDPDELGNWPWGRRNAKRLTGARSTFRRLSCLSDFSPGRDRSATERPKLVLGQRKAIRAEAILLRHDACPCKPCSCSLDVIDRSVNAGTLCQLPKLLDRLRKLRRVPTKTSEDMPLMHAHRFDLGAHVLPRQTAALEWDLIFR